MISAHPEDVALLRAIRDEPDDAARRAPLAERLRARGDPEAAVWVADPRPECDGAFETFAALTRRIVRDGAAFFAGATDTYALALAAGASMRIEVAAGLPRWIAIDGWDLRDLGALIDRLSMWAPSACARIRVPVAAVQRAMATVLAPLPAFALELVGGVVERPPLEAAVGFDGLRGLAFSVRRTDLAAALALLPRAHGLRELVVNVVDVGEPVELDLTPLAALSRLERITVMDRVDGLVVRIGGTWPELARIAISGTIERLPTAQLPRLVRAEYRLASASERPLVAPAMALRGAKLRPVMELVAGQGVLALELSGPLGMAAPSAWADLASLDVRHLAVRTEVLPGGALEAFRGRERPSSFALHVGGPSLALDLSALDRVTCLRLVGLAPCERLPPRLRALHAPSLRRVFDLGTMAGLEYLHAPWLDPELVAFELPAKAYWRWLGGRYPIGPILPELAIVDLRSGDGPAVVRDAGPVVELHDPAARGGVAIEIGPPRPETVWGGIPSSLLEHPRVFRA